MCSDVNSINSLMYLATKEVSDFNTFFISDKSEQEDICPQRQPMPWFAALPLYVDLLWKPW